MTLLQMLSVAEYCGLTRLYEAYDQHQRHCNSFFLFSEQNKTLTEEIKSYGLLDEVNGKLYLKDLSIKEVYEVMQCVK